MENFETTMSSGSPVTVNSAPISTVETGNVAESLENSSSFEVSESVEVFESSNSTIADEILESAKEEGFEKTLERLAEGDFEDKTISASSEGETSDRSQFSDEMQEGKELDDPEARVEPDDQVDPEKAALYQEIEELKAQVTDMSEKNMELAKRVANAERLNELSMQTMLEMLKLMQKLAEEEKDEEEIGILELMIKMVSFFMQSVLEGDIATDDKKKVQSAKVQGSSKKQDDGKIIDLVKRINERKTNPSQGHIEKPAA